MERRLIGTQILAALALAGWLAAAAPASGAGPYLETVLPPGTAALNDRGTVAGTRLNPAGQYHAFRWSGGVFTDLGSLGGSYSNGLGINNSGTVVGVSSTATQGAHAFIAGPGGMTDLGPLGGVASAAVDINERGQVAGNITTGEGRQRAFLYENGVARDLGTLNGTDSTAHAINEAGQIVGRSGRRAFLYDDGVMLDLGTLGGEHSAAYDINDAGQVVGAAGLAGSGSQGHAFVWQDGAMTDLGTTGHRGDFHDSAAYAINDHGDIVLSNLRDFRREAIVLENGVRTYLNLPDPLAGTSASYPFAINDLGQVLAYANPPGGEQVVVRYAPVPGIPEPGAVSLSLAGLAVLAWRRRVRSSSTKPVPTANISQLDGSGIGVSR